MMKLWLDEDQTFAFVDAALGVSADRALMRGAILEAQVVAALYAHTLMADEDESSEDVTVTVQVDGPAVGLLDGETKAIVEQDLRELTQPIFRLRRLEFVRPAWDGYYVDEDLAGESSVLSEPTDS
jgi:hypothetical protein